MCSRAYYYAYVYSRTPVSHDLLNSHERLLFWICFCSMRRNRVWRTTTMLRKFSSSIVFSYIFSSERKHLNIDLLDFYLIDGKRHLAVANTFLSTELGKFNFLVIHNFSKIYEKA